MPIDSDKAQCLACFVRCTIIDAEGRQCTRPTNGNCPWCRAHEMRLSRGWTDEETRLPFQKRGPGKRVLTIRLVARRLKACGFVEAAEFVRGLE